MSDWFQVPALVGLLENIPRIVPKPLLHCLGCVYVGWWSHRKVNFQPSLRLWTRFSLRISLYLAAFSFPHSRFTSCRWKIPSLHDAATMLHRWSMAGSHITLQPKTGCPLKLRRAEPGQYLDGRPPEKTRLLLEEVLVRPAGGAQPVVCMARNAPV